MKTTPNQRLKLFREKAGLRQEAIAVELDVSLGLVQKIEGGFKEVSDKMAEALQRRYQLPVKWLMKGEGEMTYNLEVQNPYRDTLYKELKEQIEFLKEIIRGKSPNFRTALNLSGLQKRRSLGAKPLN